MAELTTKQAELADQALARVRAAEAAAVAAVEDESWVLNWLAGSESAAAARRESLRHTQNIRADLERRRPWLVSEGLVGFLELAAAAAEVSALLESARRMTAGGFGAEVVSPTLAELDPTNLDGFAGRAVLLAVVAAVIFLVVKEA